MKHNPLSRLFSATLIILAATAQSCTWNGEKFDTFVQEDGSIISCPPSPEFSTTQPKLLFIEKLSSNDENQQTNETETQNNNIIRCAIECLPDDNNNDDKTSFKNCVPLTDSRCADFADGLKNGICPKNKECLPYNESDYYCGQKIIECKTDAECVANHESDGWTDAECKENKCFATACDDKTHLKEGTCAIDTDTACGNENRNCNEEIKESTSTRCVPVKVTSEDGSIKYEKQCEVLKCKTGYHVSDNVTNNISNKCDEDDITNCGGINCSLLSGWSDGECNQANCQSTTCLPGYHPYNKVVDGIFIACIADTDQDCGKIGNACQSEEGEIRSCVEGKCLLLGCLNGYHKSKSKDSNEEYCKRDDKYECGFTNINCTNLTGTKEDTVECISPAVCIDNTCQVGYHSTGKAGLNPCEPDTNNDCGPSHTQCSGDTPYCNYSDSNKSECSNECGNGLTFCNDGCYNTKINIHHCSDDDSCGKDCTTISSTTEYECTDGKCTKQSCKIGYHDNLENECVEDDINNCGSDGNMCSKNAPANSTPTTCSNGTCQYKCNKNNETMCNNVCRNLKDIHMQDCNTCTEGYGNCDSNITNGCETKLDEFGLTSCTTCSADYTICGNYQTKLGHSVPLCLKQGHYYKNYEGDSESQVGCHNNSYKYHKKYSEGSSTKTPSSCSDYNNNYINFDYQNFDPKGEGALKTHFYQDHFYKLVSRGWNSEKFSWSSEHCALACTGNRNFSSDADARHTDASGKTIEAWSHQCKPKEACDQFDSFEVFASTPNNNKFYFDYGCGY